MGEYRAEQLVEGVGVLMHPDGRRLLGGPETEIAAFAAELNGAPPPNDRELRGRLLDLVEGTSDCCFAPLIALDQAEADELAALLRDADRRTREAAAGAAQGRLAL